MTGPTPVVLIHGATSCARAWDPLLAMLSPKCRIFVPTLAGHRGGPPLVTGPVGVVDRIVDDMCRQLDDAAIDTAHIVGNSLAGEVRKYCRHAWGRVRLGSRHVALESIAHKRAGLMSGEPM